MFKEGKLLGQILGNENVSNVVFMFEQTFIQFFSFQSKMFKSSGKASSKLLLIALSSLNYLNSFTRSR